jgi:hypothetical protein
MQDSGEYHNFETTKMIRCTWIIVGTNLLMRFPPYGVAAGQEGLYRSLFSSWLVKMTRFDPFKLPHFLNRLNTPEGAFVFGAAAFIIFWGMGASAPIFVTLSIYS